MTQLIHFFCRFFCRSLVGLAILGIILMALSQLFGRYVWQLELFSHYVPHLAGLILLSVVLFPKSKPLLQGSKPTHGLLRRGLLALIGISLALWSLQPFRLLIPQSVTNGVTNGVTKGITKSVTNSALPSKKDTPSKVYSHKPTTVIAYQNLNINNPNPKNAVQKLIGLEEENASLPDVVALVEAGGPAWYEALNTVAQHFPTHCGVDKSHAFTIQIYSNVPRSTCEIIDVLGYPLAKVTLPSQTDNSVFSSDRILYVAHPPPPVSRNMAKMRNTYLSKMATLIKADADHSVMVIGDFNLSAFSPIYRDFKHQIMGSEESAKSFHRTTVAGLPTWLPLGIGIDHILVYAKDDKFDSNISKIDTLPLEWNGSDHRGFIVEW